MKKLFRYVQEGTPAYVVLHAQWRVSRGRRPSATFGKERNPTKALKAAQAALKQDGVHVLKPAQEVTINTMEAVMDKLGLRLLTVEEVKALRKQVPEEQLELPVPYIQWNGNRWDEQNPDRWDSHSNFKFLPSRK